MRAKAEYSRRISFEESATGPRVQPVSCGSVMVMPVRSPSWVAPVLVTTTVSVTRARVLRIPER